MAQDVFRLENPTISFSANSIRLMSIPGRSTLGYSAELRQDGSVVTNLFTFQSKPGPNSKQLSQHYQNDYTLKRGETGLGASLFRYAAESNQKPPGPIINQYKAGSQKADEIARDIIAQVAKSGKAIPEEFRELFGEILSREPGQSLERAATPEAGKPHAGLPGRSV